MPTYHASLINGQFWKYLKNKIEDLSFNFPWVKSLLTIYSQNILHKPKIPSEFSLMSTNLLSTVHCKHFFLSFYYYKTLAKLPKLLNL